MYPIGRIKRRLTRPRKNRFEDVVAENINALHDAVESTEDQMAGLIFELREKLSSIEAEHGRLANCVRELKLKVK
jgi:hypothetical protein